MRCSSLYPPRWPTGVLPCDHAPPTAVQAEAPAGTGSNPACQLTGSTSAVGRARECRRSDANAAVMQVRPPSVVAGIAGLNPFGRSAFADSGWL